MRANAGRATAGQRMRLRYRTADNNNRTRERITVRRAGSVVASWNRPLAAARWDRSNRCAGRRPAGALPVLRSCLGRGRQLAHELRAARVGLRYLRFRACAGRRAAGEEIVALARDLVAIPTENPPGAAYDECVQRICAELDALAIDYEVVETGDADTPRRSILAEVGDAGPLLYLHGHYDVVPAFTTEQFEPRLAEGRLIGRGSSDMKGGLAAIAYAARAAADSGARVGLVIVPDEETGGRLGAERLAELGRLDTAAAGAIVAEPTWGTIWHACRGAFTLRVTVRGKAAHVGLHYEV